MALFVYITDQCKDDMRTHSLDQEVERFKDRIEATQSTSQFDPFPPPYLVKKKLGGRQARLICDRRTVSEHAVVVFLAVLIRGNRDYEDEFARNPRAYGEQHFAHLVSDEELAEYVAERTRISPPPVKPDPTNQEYGLLYGAFSHHDDAGSEELICETRHWVERVAEDRIAKQLVLLCPACLKALEKEPGLHFVPVPAKPDWGIWVFRSEGRLLLITPVTEKDCPKAEELAHRVADSLNDQDASAVLNASQRAYPAIILADDDLWLDLEKDPLANMALSPEESEVLESARRSDCPFPLFVNGRAGSGKSTILQYLFTDLLYYYLSTPESRTMAPPVYLTANGELLRIARTFVERLLRSEATFAQQATKHLVDDNQDVLTGAFREFQPYLLSLLGPEERSGDFAPAKRVDYTRFRKMWKERFGHEKQALRDFGPDLSWHIIRSYIKGMSSETYLEPDDYPQLPENQVTVTNEAFKLVYDRVWTGWYQRKLEDESLWDDQDLARYILDNELAKPMHPAVFCDEAQDFTRIELELLLRLNLFSDRTLPPNSISRVPFAFAGDQFQTLNPTGFRWDAIKASFVEKFISALDPACRSGRTDLNYRELKFNYRSTQKIVRFSNHVQAMRAALFRLPDLRPQTPWTAETHSFPVVWFRANDAGFWKKFRSNPGIVVVLPCNEGEEADFVKNDLVLSENIKIEDDVPLDVLSAARAKGCEYPAVMVYGFGASGNVDVLRTLQAPHRAGASDPDKSLPMQYFINRLYVGVSRAKRRLIVVDTDEGLSKLWSCTQQEAAEHELLASIKNGQQIWGGQIEGMTAGDPNDLELESAGDPLENARAYEADGLARRDDFILIQAAQAYRIAGDQLKSRECKARALEVKGDFFEAGNIFFDGGFSTEGVHCLWRAGRKGWTRLCEKATEHPSITHEIESQWARSIIEQCQPEATADILKRFADMLQVADFADRCATEPVWRSAIEAVLKPIVDPKTSAVTEELANGLAASLTRIRAAGVPLPANPSAHVFFRARDFKAAIGLWEESGDTKSSFYLTAKASVEPYPHRVLALWRLEKLDEIIDGYKANPDVAMKEDEAAAIIDALGIRKSLSEAFSLAWKTNAVLPMLRLAAGAIRDKATQEAVRLLRAGIVLLVKQNHWDTLAQFVSAGKFLPSPEWQDEELRSFADENKATLQIQLIRALARSDALAGAPSHLQRQITEFLKNYLRVKEGKWRRQLSIEEAGAAIERGGRFTDACAFYEAVVKERTTTEEKWFAQARWLVCKNRQREYEQSQGATRRVKDIERELKQKKREQGIANVGDLPAYPELPELTSSDLAPPEKPLPKTPEEPQPIESADEAAAYTTDDSPARAVDSGGPISDSAPMAAPADSQSLAAAASIPDQIAATIGPFRLELSRGIGRCNITHTETMETAHVKTSARTCGGEVAFVQQDDATWFCQDWDLTVMFPKSSEERLRLELGKAGVGLQVWL